MIFNDELIFLQKKHKRVLDILCKKWENFDDENDTIIDYETNIEQNECNDFIYNFKQINYVNCKKSKKFQKDYSLQFVKPFDLIYTNLQFKDYVLKSKYKTLDDIINFLN